MPLKLSFQISESIETENFEQPNTPLFIFISAQSQRDQGNGSKSSCTQKQVQLFILSY